MAGVPVIVHTPHGHVFWGYFNRWITLVFIFLEKVAARITDRIIMLTEREKRDHLKAGIAPEEKFSIIHSGIKLDGFSGVTADKSAMKRTLGIAEESLVVGTAGRLTHIKGHRYLIEAAKRIVDFRSDTIFAFLGDGELSDELKNMTGELGLKENIRFLGWRPDVAEVMSVFDIFALPSLNEGMGRVLVEAMALGKPVVASDVGGIPDLVINERNGFLVPAADADALTEALQMMISDPEKRKEMGRRGKETAESYSAHSMIEKIDVLYRDLMLSRHNSGK